MQKFDVILSNAPYDNGLHEKFEAKYFSLCDGQIVWVSPLSFLLGKRQNKRITLELDKYRTDIEQINGNEFFDAAIGGTMGIVYVDMDIDNQGVTFDGKEYSECSEISLTSNDELLTEFKNITSLLSQKNSLDNYICKEPNTKGFAKYKVIHNPNINWYVLAITSLRGHRGTNDFYTIISNKDKELYKRKGQYKDVIKNVINTDDKKGHHYQKQLLEYYFAFDTETELNGFINYLKTDFCRGCLFLIKTTMHLDAGELKYIPWFDFSNPVFSKSPSEIDDYLFDKFNISDEIRKHIEELLPDYYGIRKG